MINLESAFKFHIPANSSHQQYCEFDWIVPTEMPYFEGHFPDQPMLPAFAIVDANTLILEKHLSKPLQIKKITTARFSAPIVPSMKVIIKVEKKSEDTWKCDWFEQGEVPKALCQMLLVLDFSTASAANK